MPDRPDAATSTTTRLRPSFATGTAVFLAYGVYLVVSSRLSGVAYDDLADSASTMVRGLVVPEAIGAVLLVGAWRWLGWGRQVLVDPPRLRARRFFWVPVGASLVLVAAGATVPEWGALTPGFVLAGLVGCALVGLTEELLARGLLLTGVRAGAGEVVAFLVSSAFFGLLHAINILEGQAVSTTMSQVVAAGIGGMAYYCARRVTGTLVVPIVIHGAYDFVLLMQGEGTHPLTGGLGTLPILLANLVTWVSLVVVLVMMLAGSDRRHPREGERREAR